MKFKFARIVVPLGYPEYQGPYMSYQEPPPRYLPFWAWSYDLQRFQCYCEGLKVVGIPVGTMAVTILAALAAAEASSIYCVK